MVLQNFLYISAHAAREIVELKTNCKDVNVEDHYLHKPFKKIFECHKMMIMYSLDFEMTRVRPLYGFRSAFKVRACKERLKDEDYYTSVKVQSKIWIFLPRILASLSNW